MRGDYVVSEGKSKQGRFNLLLEQLELPQDMIGEHFENGTIEKLTVLQSEKRWHFNFNIQKTLPFEIYQWFQIQLNNKFQSIAAVTFEITAKETSVDEHELIAYWPTIISFLEELPITTLNVLKNKSPKLVNQKLILPAGSDAEAMSLKRRLEEPLPKSLRKIGLPHLLLDVHVETSEEEVRSFMENREQEDRTKVQEAIIEMEKGKKQADANHDYTGPISIGVEIKDDPVRLDTIVEEEKRLTVQGYVFDVETRELRSGRTLLTLKITDYTNSLQIKYFSRDKDDVTQLNAIKKGMWVKARGGIQNDTFARDLVMIASDIKEVYVPTREDKGYNGQYRVELHAHTVMSQMDAVVTASALIEQASKWGHQAIAITDHANIHSYPEVLKAGKKNDIKVIYGLEANILNDTVNIALNPQSKDLQSSTYVIFDVETTGLSVVNNEIIELAGVKMTNGEVIDRFSTFIKPSTTIPANITNLTGITNDMVSDAPALSEKLPEFLTFIEDTVLVAHNAKFDMGFLQSACKQLGLEKVNNPVLDTLELARYLYPTQKNHRLNTLTDKFKVSLDNHHRAVDDSEATGHVLFHMLKDTIERGFKDLNELNHHGEMDLKNIRPFHCTLYAKNMIGKKNLYKLVSLSHTDYLQKVPCIPKSVLKQYREGLIVASGCEKGEFYETVLNKSKEEALEVAAFYDYLEIQPHEINLHLVDKQLVSDELLLKKANQKIIEIGEELGKPVIATGNVHYLNPHDKVYRDILITGITGYSPLKDQRKPDVHFRTTDEMIQAFSYLGEDKAFEVVVQNTNKLADEIETLQIFPDKLFTPNIEGAEEEIRTKCYDKAKEWYGEQVPEIVVARLEKELNPIIKFGFSANYLISERLVKKSNADGYLVGSRGSVGSSFVATMLGISEVNPLPPHYRCPACQYNEWFTNGEVKSGFDLEDKHCPNCETKMIGDGQDIPFETFLGFKGDKVPDIDLNFSGDYQPVAHNYTKVLFGEKNVFRAGTIGTVAEKTAFGYVKKYEEQNNKTYRSAELSRLASGCTGVKRSTGQHPGGIVVVPDYMDVEEITAVQYPADDKNSEWKTTHFDYHAFEANLLKLDILGHDDPTMMRMLQDLTGVDPTTISMNDPKVMSIFSSTEALGVSPKQIRTPVATYGIPEMGTRFVRQMLEEAKPSTFADLLQISGLSHGTGVWLGNAQELIRNQTCTISTVIGCRDEIMLYLIQKEMDSSLAFKITESVRKGRGLTEEWIQAMRDHNVPEWYIDSCLKIEYMFPKAHAAAYVISAVRSAYFKIYHPMAYYATYFSVRADDFDVELCCRGYESIFKKIEEIEEKGMQATPKEKSLLTVLEMALEMTARGFSFKGIDLYKSDGTKFIVEGDALIPPFSAIQGVGVNAAKNLAAARDEGEFLSKEDLQTRAKLTKTVVEYLDQMGCLEGLPEQNQLSLF